MSESDDQSNLPYPAFAAKHLKPWVSPRRKRFWALVAVVIYTLAGFFLLPRWIESTLVGTVHESIGHEATVERVQANPYTLSIDIEGVAVIDPGGTTWLSFDLLRVNFQLSSLFRWALSFDELRLDNPELLLERFENGETRIGRLLAAREPPPDPPEEPFSLPRLLVYNLDLNQGMVRFRDAVPAEPVSLEFGPISIAVEELSTLADREGHKRIVVELPRGATASWDGSVHLEPLEVAGRFSVDNADLSPALSYLQDTFPIDTLAAKLSLASDYSLSWPVGRVPVVALDGLVVTLADVSVTGLEPSAEFLTVNEAELSGGSLRFPDRRLQFSAGRVDGLDLDAWLRQSGKLSLLALAPAGQGRPAADRAGDGAQSGAGGNAGEGAEDGAEDASEDGAAAVVEDGKQASAAPAAGADAWRLGVDEFALAGSRVGFQDRRLEPPASMALTGIALTVRDITNQPGAAFPVDGSASLEAGGTVTVEGEVKAMPEFSADVRVDLAGVPLSMGQPYVSQVARLSVDGGQLETGFDLSLRPNGGLTASGEAAVDALDLADARDGDSLFRFERMTIDQFQVDAAAGGVEISRVELARPWGRVVINEDMTTNFTGLLVGAGQPPEQTPPGEAAPAAASAVEEDSDEVAERAGSPEEDPAPAWSARVARIGVTEGSMDFADNSLPLPFSTNIQQLDGRVTTLDTESVEPGDIELEGKVGEYGLARVSGEMDALSPLENTDVRIEFRNLGMDDLSPYTVQFAGRKIAEGSLDLDLHYRIDDTHLTASNDVVISDLVLGEKVDYPGAASLPLGLAVALLKDANGVIDVEIPVEGDVDDPQFDIGGVIWQAFTGLITKVVTAPFRLLAGLVGAGDRDLGQFEFLAGRADLTPPEREKVAQLGQALRQRPELVIVVPGAYNAEVDRPALKFQSLRERVVERLGRDGVVAESRQAMLSPEVREILEEIHEQRFPDTSLDSIRELHRAPPPDDPDGESVLDEPAYAADLRDRLLASEPVDQAELEALARQRAETIRNALLEGDGPDASRVELAPVVESESEDDEWVILELEADTT